MEATCLKQAMGRPQSNPVCGCISSCRKPAKKITECEKQSKICVRLNTVKNEINAAVLNEWGISVLYYLLPKLHYISKMEYNVTYFRSQNLLQLPGRGSERLYCADNLFHFATGDEWEYAEIGRTKLMALERAYREG